MTKICTKCGIEKSLSEFSINRRRTGGRHSYCHECLSDYKRAYDAANADSIAAKRKAHRAANPEVYSARGKAYYEANRDALLANQKAKYAANPDTKRARNRLNNKTSRALTPDVWASRRLKNHYGMTLDDYNRILEDQGGLCANPGCFNEPPADRRFDVDHDHGCCPGEKSCGKCVRGLLCRRCNHALGLLHDDVKRVRGLADYLELGK
jgi:hypothetical protein